MNDKSRVVIDLGGIQRAAACVSMEEQVMYLRPSGPPEDMVSFWDCGVFTLLLSCCSYQMAWDVLSKVGGRDLKRSAYIQFFDVALLVCPVAVAVAACPSGAWSRCTVLTIRNRPSVRGGVRSRSNFLEQPVKTLSPVVPADKESSMLVERTIKMGTVLRVLCKARSFF